MTFPTLPLMIATVFGGFLFPFLIALMWGKLVDTFGAAGGWMAALFIVGTVWAINHGTGLITQSGSAWVDMGLAAGVGLLVSSTVSGGKFGKAVPNIVAAIIGGILGGLLLSFYL
jgi:hypothetical protein